MPNCVQQQNYLEPHESAANTAALLKALSSQSLLKAVLHIDSDTAVTESVQVGGSVVLLLPHLAQDDSLYSYMSPPERNQLVGLH